MEYRASEICWEVRETQVNWVDSVTFQTAECLQRKPLVPVPESVKSEAITKLRDTRQSMSKYVLDVIIEETPGMLASEVGRELSDDKENMKKYIQSCVRVCWLFGLQMPPVHIVLEKNHEGNLNFDQNMFREYTKRGDFVDFVVWPPLQVHEGGPLLMKGVAQGKR